MQGTKEAAADIVQGDVVVAGDDELWKRDALEKRAGSGEFGSLGALRDILP